MIIRRAGGLLLAAVLLVACEEVEDVPAQDDDVVALQERIAELEHGKASLEDELDRLEVHLARIRERIIEGAPRTLQPGTVEGLEDALRAYLPDPGVPWVPGVTRWREPDLELPRELTDPDGGAESHGLLTSRLVSAVVDEDRFGGTIDEEFSFPWEVTTRILRTAEDEALAIVQQWGMGDDSVMGTDYLFTLRHGPGGWHVTDVSQRDQCTRNERLPGEDDLPEFCV